jgi:flagellar biosynthesis/type III secretory pathway M-ring protein FliF/YscJ
MFSSRFVKLASQNRSVWKAGLAVVVAGTTFKVVYFNFSRSILVDHMNQRDVQAREHLHSARQYGSEAAVEREERVPQLSPEQREQLKEYLRLMADNNPEVYPKPRR